MKLIIAVADERVASQQMLIGLPLIEDSVTLLGTADGVEHITVALTMHALLKVLNMQTEVHLVGRDIFAHTRQIIALQRIEEDQETEYLVVRLPLSRLKMGVVFDVLRKVDLFGIRSCSWPDDTSRLSRHI